MRIIDLLNKIANDDGIPMKILFRNYSYWYDKEEKDYYNFIGEDYSIGSRRYLLKCYFTSDILNEKIDIIDNILEDKEEKKIPEKLEDRARFQYSEIPTWLEKKEIIKAINENFEKHQKAIYEIIDYLKSKGE